jgi:hypothetical protein
VEFPDDATDDHIRFVLEENGCPGTGSVGLAIEMTMIKYEEQSTCWACALQGENEIVSIGAPA